MDDFKSTELEQVVGATEQCEVLSADCPNAAEPPAQRVLPKHALGVSQEQCAQELRQQFNWKDGELREIRVMDWPGDLRPRIAAVTSPEAAASIIAEVPYGASVFTTMNPLDPERYSAGSKVLKKCGKGGSAADMHVAKRTCFGLDIDPVRPAETCATPEQLLAAAKLAKELSDFLIGTGWSEPTVVCSGNGTHLYWVCDLPAESDIPSRVLKALSNKFSTAQVKVDTTIGNAGRIMRCVGTWNTKGGLATAANHRLAAVASVGSSTMLCTENFSKLLREGAEPIVTPCKATSQATPKSGGSFDVEAWMKKHGVQHGGCEDWPGGGAGAKRWVLEACAFDPSHDRGEAVITRKGDGTLGHKCHHDSCSEFNWKKFRALVESKAKSKEAVVSADAGGPHRYGQRNPYPLASLPRIIRDAVELQTKITGVDPAAIAVPMLASFLGVIGASVRVRVYEGWEEAMAAYCALVVPSGGQKSSTLDFCVRALNDLEQLFPVPLEGEARMRLVTSDPTVEALAKLVSENPRGLIVHRDELAGFYGAIGQYKAKACADESFWLTAVDGGRYVVDRKTTGSYIIPSLILSVIGGIQPTILKTILNRSLVESGMASRFWYIYPPRKQQEFKIPSPDAAQAMESVKFQLVLAMQSLRTIPIEGAKPFQLQCTLEAQQLLNEYATMQEEIGHLLPDVSMERSYRAKSRGWCVRLAGLKALLRSTCPVIDPKNTIDYSGTQITAADMIAGIEMASWQVEENTRLCKALELDDMDGELARKNEIAMAAIGAGQTGLTVRELCRSSALKTEVASDVLESLVKAELWIAEHEPIGSEGGRPSKRYHRRVR